MLHFDIRYFVVFEKNDILLFGNFPFGNSNVDTVLLYQIFTINLGQKLSIFFHVKYRQK
jgi:hypothetical protein